MTVTSKARYTLVFLTILTVGILPAVAAQEFSEISFDESDAPPYTPEPSIWMGAPAPARWTQGLDNSAITGTEVRLPLAFARVHDRDSAQSPDSPDLLKLFCTFLC